MSSEMKDTQAQWDDVPGKVVGRRRQGVVNLEQGAGLLRMGYDRNLRLPGRPRGVFRFRTHEEANR